MPKLNGRQPKYRLHKRSGLAVVTIHKQDHYLGKWSSDENDESHKEYYRLMSEYYAGGCQPEPAHADDLTCVELAADYLDHAEKYYVKNGETTSEYQGIKDALRPFKELYGRTLVKDFGPVRLKTVRNRMIELGLRRRVINTRIAKICRMFKWAVSNEMLPESAWSGLKSVEGLKEGRTTAKEPKTVSSVPDAVVDATLPKLPPIVADMVRFQRLTGCRPGEACIVRPIDVTDRTEDVWTYTPWTHKTEHRGKKRIIPIGPKAQKILTPYLLRSEEAYCFSPRESEAKRRAELNLKRKSPLRPSENRKRKRKKAAWQPGEKYSGDSYRGIIIAACKAAEVKPWNPNQLRHTAGTEIATLYDDKTASAVLGHSDPKTTKAYIDQARELRIAREVMLKIG